MPHSYHMIAYRRSDIKLQLGKRFDNGRLSFSLFYDYVFVDFLTYFVATQASSARLKDTVTTTANLCTRIFCRIDNLYLGMSTWAKGYEDLFQC